MLELDEVELAKIRHELRTPINHILGYGEMVAEELEDIGRKDLVSDVQKVRDAGRNLLGLIDRYLRSGRAGEKPAQIEPIAELRKTDAGPSQAAVASPDRRSFAGHLLVVDDNRENREMLARRLEREGFSTKESPNGEDALFQVAEGSFDLILLDVMMPGIDGYEVLVRLKQDPVLRHVPVIMISALDELASVVRCIEAGAEDYLPKPFEPALLRARIGASLEKKRLRDQEQQHVQTIERTQARLTAELSEAAKYVRSIFPEPMDQPVRIDWKYEPSGELGGDTFGYHLIDADHLSIYLLDVCGHGVGAALLSVAAINVIRSGTLPNTDFRDPASVLSGLNEAFQMDRQNNMYFTIWYGVLHLPTLSLRHSSGGHPPALVVRKDRSVQELRCPGLLIGAMEGTRYSSETFQLDDEDTLFVLCDGTYEVRKPDGTMFEFEDFKAYLSTHGCETDGLDQLLAWAHGGKPNEPLDDDFSIVRIDVKP